MSAGYPVTDGRDAASPDYRTLVLAVVVVWGLGDAASTLLALELTGSAAAEANPLVRALLVTHPGLLIVLKAGVATVVGGLLTYYRPLVESVPGWRLWFVAVLAVGSAVVAGNLYAGLAAVL